MEKNRGFIQEPKAPSSDLLCSDQAREALYYDAADAALGALIAGAEATASEVSGGFLRKPILSGAVKAL